jgi:hypothetical protein
MVGTKKNKKQKQKQAKMITVVVPKPKPNRVRNAPRVKGQGAYSIGDLWSAVKRPFTDSTESKGMVNKGARAIGSLIGDETGIPGASRYLGNAGSWLSRAFGFGSYEIKSNSLMNQNIAQFSSNGSIEFSHREFVTDISSSTGFTLQNYLINPGNNLLFPWLSTIAQNFEQYEMKGLIFEFKSTSAMAVGSVNTGLGTLIMATDYDVLDSNFDSKRAMEISDFATSGAPSNSQIHPVECDPKLNVLRQLFIQPGNNLATYPDDARFSAMGNFEIATSGMQAISAIGELWVSYHVKLHKPQLNQLIANNRSHGHYSIRITSDNTVGTNQFDQTVALSWFANYNNANKTVSVISQNQSALGDFMIIVSGATTGPTETTWGDINTPDPPSMGGGAELVDNVAWDAGLPMPRDERLSRGAIPTIGGGNANNYCTNGAVYLRTWIVRFPLVASAAVFPINNVVGVGTVHDFYIVPYTIPPNSSLKIKKKYLNDSEEFSQVQKELDFLKKSNKELLTQFKQLKLDRQAGQDWETSDCMDSNDLIIDGLNRENIDNYTLEVCIDKIGQIGQLLQCSLRDSQINFLTNRLKQVVTKQKCLVSTRKG